MAEASVVKQPKQKSSGLTRTYGWEPLSAGSLFNVNPFSLMRQFTEDMDRMFGSTAANESQSYDWLPAIEVKEEKGKLLVKADLPGVTKENIKVSATDGILFVEGERKHEKEEKREGYFHSERSFGRFSRSIRLPDGARTAQASASFINGVLEIAVPIQEAHQKRQEIPVKEGAM